jgi:hypothetical protein
MNFINQVINKMKILIVMSYDKNIEDYASLSSKINKNYCIKNGYSICIEKEANKLIENKDVHITWNKIRLLEILLHEYRDVYDWIFYIDSDAIFNNHDIRLENIIEKYEKYNLIMASDKPMGGKLINSGTILVKNCDWSRKFFTYWYNGGIQSIYKSKFPHEQEFFYEIWNNSSFNLPRNVYITETQEINSTYPYESNPKDIFILHLMSTSKDFRIKKFLQFSKNF